MALSLALTSPPSVMSFDDSVAFALAHHPSLRAAGWEERASEGAMAYSRAQAWPQLVGNASAYHASQRSSVTFAQDALAASLQLTVPLLAPQTWGDWTHAQTAVRVQRQHTLQTRRSLAIGVAQTYFDVVLAARLVEVGSNAVEQGRAHFNYAHTRFVGGVGTQLDELRADQDLAQSQSIAVSAADNLLQMQAALGVSMGAEQAVGTEAVQALAVRRDLPDQADDIEARADVQEAVAALGAAQQIEDDNWRDYSPSLLARGEPFWAHPSTPILPNWGWSASIALSVPFYDGGVRYGWARERHALAEERRATLAMVRRVARSEVRAARATFELAGQAHEVARRASLAAHESVSLATQAYRSGSTDNLAVIDAQRSDRDAATGVAIAEDALLRAHLAYLAAVGMFPP